MNAIVNETRSPARVAPHATHKMKWLLKREFWEHKGGFFWAPIVAGAIFLFFTLLGGGTGQMMFSRHGGKIINYNGQEMPLSEVDWNQLIAHASPEDLRQFGEAINLVTVMSAFWPMVVFSFVVFFYLLGSLYDERKDRSVLFWKSLPVSDSQTVLSKVLTAMVVAPLIATVLSIAAMLAFGVIVSVFIAINGGNPLTLYWGQLRPLDLLFMSFGGWPIYILWALPTVGWLMLCSAWAKSKPFLWAVLLPILAGVVVSWFGLFGGRGPGDGWFWQHIVARLLTGTFPGSHLLGYAGTDHLQRLDDSAQALYGADSVVYGFHLFSTPQLWIGALVGIAMIILAIRLRRWRDDA
ncbi:MAG: hypothetical protein Q4G62_05955 [Pseudomonadota bacterium]|nr:hypothetical protein [Pseudomonadota bacterium]